MLDRWRRREFKTEESVGAYGLFMIDGPSDRSNSHCKWKGYTLVCRQQTVNLHSLAKISGAMYSSIRTY